MSSSASAMRALVAAELDATPDTGCRNRIARLLVEPTFVALAWEYGAPGATYLCCIVARLEDGDGVLVYCEDGFGPGDPWGSISLAAGSMGMDDRWFVSLYDAAIAAGLCDAPPGYEVP